MTSPVRAIAFDVMDTLLSDPYRDALRAATGLSLGELAERRRPGLWPAFERGELDEEQYWAAFEADGIPCDPAAFHRVRRAGTRWLPGMERLLADLSGVVRRVTASNYPVWIEEVATVHLRHRLDEIVASCHLGARKPEPDFYARLLERLGLPASDVLFVDDRAHNVDSALELGIAAHRFVDAATLRTWLREHGVQVPDAGVVEGDLAGGHPPQHDQVGPTRR
jgi:FMN hydrolase / 5-amino-6-(5-phospho-D-ribitylamino)uracil phosphatase